MQAAKRRGLCYSSSIIAAEFMVQGLCVCVCVSVCFEMNRHNLLNLLINSVP